VVICGAGGLAAVDGAVVGAVVGAVDIGVGDDGDGDGDGDGEATPAVPPPAEDKEREDDEVRMPSLMTLVSDPLLRSTSLPLLPSTWVASTSLLPPPPSTV
jgi:hypothetical protein